MAKKDVFAVLTGDIVDSSELNEGLGYPISRMIKTVEPALFDVFGSVIYRDIDLFRGDSWQMVVLDPSQSLRISLLFRALLCSERKMERIDTRVSIGFGTINHLPEEDISSGNGEAYTLSGSGLDGLKRNRRMNLSFPPQNRSSLTRGLDAMLQFLDHTIQRWTSKQADAVAGALLGLTQREIASTWFQPAVSQQAVSQHLDNAGWTPIISAIHYFEAVLPEILTLS